MRQRDRPASLFLRVWRWPILLAALTIFGLLSALLGQPGIWHGLSWITLCIPLLVILRFAAGAARSHGDGKLRHRSSPPHSETGSELS